MNQSEIKNTEITLNDFKDLNSQKKQKYNGKQIIQQKLEKLQQEGEQLLAQKEYCKYLQVLKKQLLLEKNNIKLFIKYGQTLMEMGDLNNAIKYFMNVEGIQMMDYYTNQCQQHNNQIEEIQQVKLTEAENDEYLLKLEQCQKIQGLLNMNYGLLKTKKKTVDDKQEQDVKGLGIDLLEFSQNQLEQKEIMDFKQSFKKYKFSDTINEYQIQEKNDKQKEIEVMIQLLGLLSQNERIESLRLVDKYLERQGLHDLQLIDLKTVSDCVVSIWFVKGIILFSMDKAKHSSYILWHLYIHCNRPLPFGQQVFYQMLSYFLCQSQYNYKQCQQLLLTGEYPKCHIYIQASLDYQFWNPQTLIIRSFLDRKNQQYDKSLQSLESAYKTVKLIQQVLQPQDNKEQSLQQQQQLQLQQQIQQQQLQQQLQLLTNEQEEEKLRMQISLCYNEMGQYFYQKKKYSEAYSIFNEALEFQKEDYGIYVNRGDCLRENSLLEDALKDYLKALEIFNQKNNTLQQQQQQKLNNQKLQIHQRISMLFHRLGIEYFNQANYQSAKEVIDKAIEFDPNNYQLYLNKGKCCQNLNDVQGSIKNFKQSLKLNPNQTNVTILLKSLDSGVKVKKQNIIKIEDDD